MAELADAIDLGSIPKGWGFESLYPHHRKHRAFYRKEIATLNRVAFSFLIFARTFAHTDLIDNEFDL